MKDPKPPTSILCSKLWSPLSKKWTAHLSAGFIATASGAVSMSCTVTTLILIVPHISPYLIMLHDSSAYPIIWARSFHMSSHLIISPHISPYLLVAHHISSFLVISRHTSSYLIISPHISSYPIRFHENSSYFIISHHISSYLSMLHHISS